MWKHLNSSFRESIQIKLTVYFLLILIPVVFISLYSNAQSYNILQKQLSKQAQSVLQAEAEYIDLIMQNIEELSILISTDKDMNQLLNQITSELTPTSILDLKEILDEITKMSNTNNLVSDIAIFHTTSNTFLSSTMGGIRVTDLENETWFQKTIAAQGQKVLLIPSNNQVKEDFPFNNPDHVVFLRLLDFNNPLKENNIIAISIPKDNFFHFAKDFGSSNNARFYLFSNDEQLVSTTDQKSKIQLASDLQNIKQDNDDFLQIDVKAPLSKWTLSMLQPNEEFYEELDKISIYTYLIIILSILLALLISWLVYKTISSPLSYITQGMKNLEQGNLNIQLKEDRNDEFGYVTKVFNQMATEQKHLIKDIYEKQLRVTKTELKFLQSQINPHFLYNTLDSIYWMAKDHDAEEISEMVFNLSKFFRLSLIKSDETVNLESAIEHLNYYIRIQQIRFMDNFTVDYQIAENTKNTPIVKLLLQPLVENAILHGLERTNNHGLLSIKTSIDENRLKVEIRDNGIGMKAERLRYIKDELAKITMEKLENNNNYQDFNSDIFGMRNVMSRLKLYYGDQSDLLIESKETSGTTVILFIPVDRLE